MAKKKFNYYNYEELQEVLLELIMDWNENSFSYKALAGVMAQKFIEMAEDDAFETHKCCHCRYVFETGMVKCCQCGDTKVLPRAKTPSIDEFETEIDLDEYES